MSVQIKLTVPINSSRGKYESLTIGVFKVSYLSFIPDELYNFDFSSALVKEKVNLVHKIIPLIAALSNIEVSCIETMALEDMLNILEKFQLYFNKFFD